MARFTTYQPGQFSWVDLMTPDPDASSEFYSQLFGWQGEATQDDQGGGYTMLKIGEDDVAGMGKMPDELKNTGMPPSWNSYITVEDTDATAKRAQELGAQIQMPSIDIRTDGELVGRMAILADPEGAHISLWQPGSHAGSAIANQPGSFCWNELCSRDPEGAARFYEALFGWNVLPGDAENGYREIQCSDRLNGGILPWQEDMGEMPPAWTVYFAVADCDATIEKTQSLGGQLIVGPVEIEAGRFAVLTDSLGAVFNVMKVNNPE